MTSSDGNATPMTDIHDIKPLLSMGPDLQWLYWVLGALVIGGLALMAWYLWRRRNKAEPSTAAPPPVPPHIEAFQALDALAAQTGISGKQYYFRLSAILRRYLERRYGFPAAEMTTEELLPRLDGLPMDADLFQAVKDFCRSADPIKFAGADASRNRMHDHMAMARHFIRQTTAEEEAASEDASKQKPAGAQAAPGEPSPSATEEI
jgi:hypothetical protein